MGSEYSGFEYQPSILHPTLGGACGAFSFSHSLTLIGIPTDRNESVILCKYTSPVGSLGNKVNWGELKKIRKFIDLFDDVGTIEDGLVYGINKVHCKPILFHTNDTKTAKKFIDKNLNLGYPIILAVNWEFDYEDDGHWMVCAGKYSNKYIIIDSAPHSDFKYKKIDLYTWSDLTRRFVWYEDEDDEDGYYGFDLIAVKPKSTPSCVRQIGSIFPELYKNEYLQEWWGYYLSDLIDVAENNFSKKKDSILLYNFLSSHYDKIVDNLLYWFADIDKKSMVNELNNYLTVAKAYQFRIPGNKKEETLISFSSALVGALLY